MSFQRLRYTRKKSNIILLSFARAKERRKEKHEGYGKTPDPEFTISGSRKQFQN